MGQLSGQLWPTQSKAAPAMTAMFASAVALGTDDPLDHADGLQVCDDWKSRVMFDDYLRALTDLVQVSSASMSALSSAGGGTGSSTAKACS